MKKLARVVIIVSLLSVVLIGCGAQPTATPISDQAIKSTVDAAIQATAKAQQSTSATIEAAVKATTAASSTTAPTAAPTQPLPTAAPTKPLPTPIPAEQYATMTEEELAALIDQSVTTAVNDAITASSSTANATSDNIVTAAEVAALEAVVNEAEAAISAATAAIQAYYGLYGELATETLATLQAIEQDLAAMNDSLMAIANMLTAIDTSLQQGIALAEDTINQLTAAAQGVKTNIDKVLDSEAPTWLSSVKTEIDNRARTVSVTQPTDVASNRQGAVQSATKYLDTVRASLSDKKISIDELSAIALDGANAVASLKAVGGPELQGLANSIASLTNQLARGQLPQAQISLSKIQIPSLPSIPKPSR